MNAELVLTQPAVYLALCLGAGLLVAGILYWGGNALKPSWRLGLAVLRGLAVSTLAFLLLGPLLRSVTTRSQKPVLILAEDRSESVGIEGDTLVSAFAQLANNLADKYDVQRIAFGSSVRDAADTSRDAATDLSAVFDYAADAFAPELLGAIVLSSDGIFNQGNDPTYSAAKIASPVYTVTLGDTTVSRDVAVKELLYNRIAYLGDKVEIQADIQALNASGSGSTITLSAVNGPRVDRLDSKQVNFVNSDEFKTVRFEVELKRAGIAQYRISASPVGDERNRANNTREVYLDVLDGRQQILILAAAPHPDISALRQALDKDKNYETRYNLISDFRGNAADFDLVIFHNLPATGKEVSSIVSALDSKNAGRLFIAGPPTDLTALTRAQSLLALTPKTGGGNAVTPRVRSSFGLFTIPQNWTEVINRYPPALAPFAEYKELAAGGVLLTQRIGRVDTDFPLLAMGEINGSKIGVLSAQDIWRWRLNEFQQTDAHEVFDGLMLATVQYLALRADKRPFRVSSAEKVYATSDNVRLQAELYNASFQLVNDSDVSVSITDAKGARYPFTMDKVGMSYQLRAGRLPAGSYTYSASTTFDGKDYSASGGFTVRAVELETLVTTADWSLLRRLADQQGGISVSAKQVGDLEAAILASDRGKPVLYQSVRTRPLIDWPWLLAIVLALLAVEWFARRRLGTY